jgi:mRNA-degrading endonuclease toxin of MazEF toxin-antitoxin module
MQENKRGEPTAGRPASEMCCVILTKDSATPKESPTAIHPIYGDIKKIATHTELLMNDLFSNVLLIVC